MLHPESKKRKSIRGMNNGDAREEVKRQLDPKSVDSQCCRCRCRCRCRCCCCCCCWKAQSSRKFVGRHQASFLQPWRTSILVYPSAACRLRGCCLFFRSRWCVVCVLTSRLDLLAAQCRCSPAQGPSPAAARSLQPPWPPVWPPPRPRPSSRPCGPEARSAGSSPAPLRW